MADRGPVPSQPRLGGLDALRGAALCGMVAFHAAWDLADLGWRVTSPAGSPAWTLFGDVVAGTFLTLSGVALVLARPKGTGYALRRLAGLALAAGLVTAASFWFAPDAPIFFGILHCLAACNAIALVLIGWPAPLRLGIALAIAGAAFVRSPAFDGWPLAVLGLGTSAPATLDYRPLVPWLAAVLVGTLLGDILRRRPGLGARLRSGPAALRWLGRHSLVLYLVHQPLLYGGLELAGSVMGTPTGAGQTDPFTLQCRSDCADTGVAPRICAAACACAAETLVTESRSSTGRSGALTPSHLDDISRACRAAGG